MESTHRESTRLDSTRLSPLFTLVRQATNDSFKLNKEKGFVRKLELEGERFETINQSLLENPCTFIYICIHFRFVSSLVTRSKADDRRNEKGARGGGNRSEQS